MWSQVIGRNFSPIPFRAFSGLYARPEEEVSSRHTCSFYHTDFCTCSRDALDRQGGTDLQVSPKRARRGDRSQRKQGCEGDATKRARRLNGSVGVALDPDSHRRGKLIGLPEVMEPGTVLFHAGAVRRDSQLASSGERALRATAGGQVTESPPPPPRVDPERALGRRDRSNAKRIDAVTPWRHSVRYRAALGGLKRARRAGTASVRKRAYANNHHRSEN